MGNWVKNTPATTAGKQQSASVWRNEHFIGTVWLALVVVEKNWVNTASRAGNAAAWRCALSRGSACLHELNYHVRPVVCWYNWVVCHERPVPFSLLDGRTCIFSDLTTFRLQIFFKKWTKEKNEPAFFAGWFLFLFLIDFLLKRYAYSVLKKTFHHFQHLH